ncbi:MAG: molybdopterin-dependent oxidoreductase, partial [Planctomycetota bacterium]
MIDLTEEKIPPGQQLVAKNKWPIIGERKPASHSGPWTLSVFGQVEERKVFTVDELRSLKQTHLRIDLHCVTRWSRQKMEFKGVLLSDLLKETGKLSSVNFVSFNSRSDRNHSSSLDIQSAIDLNTLIALDVDDEPLPLDHGGPIRNIVPGRYFYKSVKWLEGIELRVEDRLGFWEAETGYHNHADPWKEERYMAPAIDRKTAIRLIETKDFSNRDLRSIDASNRSLIGLKANHALLRDANFQKSNLQDSDFTDANLSNAHLQEANFQGTQFIRTDLEGANLSGADLRGAKLVDCSLVGASFFQDLD